MKTRIYAVLIAFVFFSLTFQTSAKESASVFPQESCYRITGESETDIPIAIKNNQGISGFRLMLSYPEDVITVVGTERGSLLSYGNYADSIGTETKGQCDVVWNNTGNIYGDGILFNIKVLLKSEYEGEVRIDLSYSQDDTFNESWEDVVFDTTDIILYAVKTGAAPDYSDTTVEVSCFESGNETSSATDLHEKEEASNEALIEIMLENPDFVPEEIKKEVANSISKELSDILTDKVNLSFEEITELFAEGDKLSPDEKVTVNFSNSHSIGNKEIKEVVGGVLSEYYEKNEEMQEYSEIYEEKLASVLEDKEKTEAGMPGTALEDSDSGETEFQVKTSLKVPAIIACTVLITVLNALIIRKKIISHE